MALALHIIPYNGIGGVEVAARSLPAGLHGTLRFGRIYLSRKGEPLPPHNDIWAGPSDSEWSVRNYLGALWQVLRRKPDIVILSLWRSCIVGILAKVLCPRLKLVLFLHVNKPVHLPDRVLHWIAIRLATEIWTDSHGTLAARLPDEGAGRVISFVTEKLPPLDATPVAPRFIFWGRLHFQKGLDRGLEILGALAKRRPGVELTVIGPDAGQKEALKMQAERMGLAVTFMGPLAREAIFEQAGGHCFFLMPSRFEGMAMSVVEAMQLGLVPVVTPVGEIAHYARDGENAVILGAPDPERAAQRLDALLNAPDRLCALSRAARARFEATPLYGEDVLRACRDLLAKRG